MILVFGSINIDLVVPVPGLPRPGETVLGGDYKLLPGGKGANQALAARRAGAQVMMAGTVGGDAFASLALDLLRRDGADLSLVQQSGRPTGCAAVIVGTAGGQRGENQIAVASGANRDAKASGVPDVLLGPATTVVGQMEVPVGETAALLRRARAAGARTVLNLAPAVPLDPPLFADIDILVANKGEAFALDADPSAIARQLREAFIVTRGADGSTAFLAAGGQIAIPALKIEPIDTTGAGDTFVGVLAAALDRKLPLGAALREASAAAALACLAPGAQTAMPDHAAIEAAVERLRHP